MERSKYHHKLSSNKLDIDIFNHMEKQSISKKDKKMSTNNSLNILNSTNTRPHKQKVIATVNIIQGEITESDYNYYLNIIQSGIHVIRFIISILNEKYYNYLKVSHDLMKRLMKEKNVTIPIMISVDYMILRMINTETLILKKKEKLKIKFSNESIIEEDSLLYKSPSMTNIFFITNYEYALSNKLKPGDKIIIDFGKALLTISKVYKKNGQVTEMSMSEIDSDLETNLTNKSTQIFDSLIEGGNNEANNSLILPYEIHELIDNYYENQQILSKTEFEEANNFDFIEVIVNYDCKIAPRRPAQIYKKKKYDKYNYIPIGIESIVGRIIEELDIDYISVDHTSLDLYNFMHKKIKESKKTIFIITKISNLYELDLICNNSIGVLLALNYFCIELSFFDIVMMTEKILRLLKSKGKCVIIYSNFLESLLKQQKPTMTELLDIKSFVEMGIDGYVLGSETLDKAKCLVIVNSLVSILDDLAKYVSKVDRLKSRTDEIDNKISINKAILLGSNSIFNSLRNNPEINLVIISDQKKVFKEFLSNNLMNNIFIVSNNKTILKMFSIYAVSFCLYCEDIDNEINLIKFLKNDEKIKLFNKNPFIFTICLKGKYFEFFNLILD